MNNNYNGQVPPQQPGYQQQPMMYGQPQQKKSNVGLIIALVFGIPIILAVIIAVVVPLATSLSRNKSTIGKWECTGTSTNAEVEINSDNTFVLTIKNSYTSSTMKGKAKFLGSDTTSTKKKDGYSYRKYKIVDANVSGATNSNITESDNLGFIFGVDGEGNGHYIDSESVTALEYTCKKK